MLREFNASFSNEVEIAGCSPLALVPPKFWSSFRFHHVWDRCGVGAGVRYKLCCVHYLRCVRFLTATVVAAAIALAGCTSDGFSPDIEVLQEVPEELKARTDTRGEASLRGHLKAEGDEQTGSQSYIPSDRPKDDKALHTALDLIRGIQKNSAYPPNPKTAVPN